MDNDELLALAENELIRASSVNVQPLDAAIHALRSLAASFLVSSRVGSMAYDHAIDIARGEYFRPS